MLRDRRKSVSTMAYILLLMTHAFIAQGAEPDKWEKSIKAFEKKDQESPPRPGGLLFVGSSSIRMWDLSQSFPDRLVLNRGFGGSQMSDVIRYVDRIVIPYKPSVIVVYEGDNDIAKGKSVPQVVQDYETLIGRIHEELPETRIVFLSIKPSPKRWALFSKMQAANQQIKELTEKDPRLEFVDVSQVMIGDDGQPIEDLFLDDGLHMNEKGYRRWADLVRPHLSRP